jgi:GntR family transcriptional regulator
MLSVHIQHTMTPLIELQLDSPTPAYRQIAASLRRHFVEGGIPPGTILPTVRQVAMDLGVHFNTVAQAYRLLADEGWLDLRRRRGALVVEREAPPQAKASQVEALIRRMHELTAEFRSAGMTQRQIALALRRVTKGTIS